MNAHLAFRPPRLPRFQVVPTTRRCPWRRAARHRQPEPTSERRSTVHATARRNLGARSRDRLATVGLATFRFPRHRPVRSRGHSPSMTRSPHEWGPRTSFSQSPAASLYICERFARCPPVIPCTTNMADANHMAISWRMMVLDQVATAREAAPADSTARCAPSRSSSLRCGPPLTARAAPTAWLLRLHARALRFRQRNRVPSKTMSSRKMRFLRKHSQREKTGDSPCNTPHQRTPEFQSSACYRCPRDATELSHW